MALSYQHEFHAGNFADLQKHLALTLMLSSFCKKEKPFTVIDTHAGAGRFFLNDARLEKTEEAKAGIKKLMAFYEDPAIPMSCGLKKYLSIEKPYFDKNLYAGSPEIERIFLREKDKIFLVEKHPQAFKNLEENLKLQIESAEGKKNCLSRPSVYQEDSYKALNFLTPPLIKRGFIICDPSYEDLSDYQQVAKSLSQAHKKWNTASILLWYPLLTHKKNETEQMLSSLEDFAKIGNMPVETLRVEMIVKNPNELEEDSSSSEKKSRFYGSGIFVMNPPWKFQEELEEGTRQIQKLLSLI